MLELTQVCLVMVLCIEHDKSSSHVLYKRKWCDGGDGAEPTKRSYSSGNVVQFQ